MAIFTVVVMIKMRVTKAFSTQNSRGTPIRKIW
jgi:hypothetical protein